MQMPEADFEQKVAALRAHGHEVPVHEFGPLGEGAANSRSAYVHDPDGHLVEFWTADMGDYGTRLRLARVQVRTPSVEPLDSEVSSGEGRAREGGASRKVIAASVVIATALLAPAAASAAAPVLQPLRVSIDPNQRSITANWTLPPNMHGWLIEVATSSDTYPSGDLKGQFLQENVIGSTILFVPNPTTYWFDAQPGTFWVHVAAYDETAPACVSPSFPTCVKEFSNAESAEILNSAPGMLSVGHASRHLTAEWWKSVWHSNVFIEAATSPDVYTSGPLEGLFRDENLMLYDDTLSQDQRTFSSTEPLPPGTYWVHVATEDISGCCGTDITAPLTVTIPPNPPVLQAATQQGGVIHAEWSLPSGMFSDFVEVARSPAVYPDGPLAGLFLDENLTLYDDVLTPGQTSWDADSRLPDGLYYVHVGALAAGACPTLDALTCVAELSQVLPVRVGVAPPAPVATAAVPDTATAFASLSVARRMSFRRLVVRAVMAEPGTLTVNGTIGVPGASKVFRLKTLCDGIAGQIVSLRPALSKPALKSIRKALRRHRRVRLKLTVTARDVAGNVAVQRRTALLRR